MSSYTIPPLDEAVEAALASKHGDDLLVVPTEAGDIVVRRASAIEWGRFRDSDKKYLDEQALFRACVVHPSAADHAALLAAFPAATGPVCAEIILFSGARVIGESRSTRNLSR